MIDLHTHSSVSDGTLTPADLVTKAGLAGLSAIALSDHDTIAGLEEFMETGQSAALETIAGVEISTRYQQTGIHLLGLFVDPQNSVLRELLARSQYIRHQRNELILKRLAHLGIHLPAATIARQPGHVICRTQIAQAIVAAGSCATIQDAFQLYLGRGRQAYVSLERPPLREALSAIKQAGGLSFLAHPTLLLGKPLKKARRTCVALKQDGLDGIEVYYSTFDSHKQERLLRLARESNLLVSGGSDFHGSNKPMIALGTGYGSLSIPASVLDTLKQHVPAGR